MTYLTLTIIIASKAISQSINRHVLTGTNPCINKAIHVLLMHNFLTLRIRTLGWSQN